MEEHNGNSDPPELVEQRLIELARRLRLEAEKYRALADRALEESRRLRSAMDTEQVTRRQRRSKPTPDEQKNFGEAIQTDKA